jgi:hypothetical protein
MTLTVLRIAIQSTPQFADECQWHRRRDRDRRGSLSGLRLRLRALAGPRLSVLPGPPARPPVTVPFRL